MFDYFWWHASVLWIGSFAIYWIATHRPSSTSVLVVVLSLFLGVIGYTRFGQMHGGRDYHYSEIWQYYMGSKYYKELSQKYLYVSAVGAFEELKAARSVPHVFMVRDLEEPFAIYSGQEAERIFKEKARPQFTDARWEQFKSDISGFLDCGWSQGQWQYLGDVGYNPPPSYSVLAGSIASLVPINPHTISLVPFIDWSLVALAAAVVFRTFGFLGSAVFLLIFLTNDLACLYWIGGAFCRNFWFVALTMAMCALEKRRYFWAGMAYGFATAMRVFPFVFLFGACLPFLPSLCKDPRGAYKPIAGLLTGALLALSSLVFISLLEYPASHWIDFFSKIFLHNKTFFVMHLGYDKLAAHTLKLAPQYFGDGISSFENWNVLVNDRFNAHWAFHRCVALLFSAASIFVCLRADPKMASLLAGETILFFFTLPANYYYIYLATFGIVATHALKETPFKGNSLRFWSLMVFLIFSNMVGAISSDWIVLNWWINLALLLLLSLYIISQLVQVPLKWQEDKARIFITLVFVALLAALTFKPRELPSTNTNGLKTQVLVYTPQNIKAGNGWMQDLHNYSPHWPTKELLLVRNPKGEVCVIKYFDIPKKGKYMVTFFYARAIDYVDAQIDISSMDHRHLSLATWSSFLVLGRDDFICEFPQGLNSIRVQGKGSPGRPFLGLNSTVLKPL